MVAQAVGVNVDEAFTVIRDHARQHSRKLSDVAHALLTDPAFRSQLLRS